jgi:hypothetical protein
MNALVLDMPDDPAARAPWLDRRLVGPDLAALVAELDAIHGRGATPSQSSPTLEAVLAGDRRALLERGLSALPPARSAPCSATRGSCSSFRRPSCCKAVCTGKS